MRVPHTGWQVVLPILVLLLSSCTNPLRTIRSHAVDAEFLADGTCRVAWNGKNVSLGYSPKTTYSWGGVVNMAPAGYAVHTVWCDVAQGEDYWTHKTKLLLILTAPQGSFPAPGEYRVDGSAPGAAGGNLVSVSLWHPDLADDGFFGSHLEADSGTMTLVRADSLGFVGTVKARARSVCCE